MDEVIARTQELIDLWQNDVHEWEDRIFDQALYASDSNPPQVALDLKESINHRRLHNLPGMFDYNDPQLGNKIFTICYWLADNGW